MGKNKKHYNDEFNAIFKNGVELININPHNLANRRKEALDLIPSIKELYHGTDSLEQQSNLEEIIRILNHRLYPDGNVPNHSLLNPVAHDAAEDEMPSEDLRKDYESTPNNLTSPVITRLQDFRESLTQSYKDIIFP